MNDEYVVRTRDGKQLLICARNLEAAQELACRDGHNVVDNLSDYAKQNAKGYIFPDESVLPNNYPVYPGYAYVAVFEDGEVKQIASPLKGIIAGLIRDLERGGKSVAEVRRCNLTARSLNLTIEDEEEVRKQHREAIGHYDID